MKRLLTGQGFLGLDSTEAPSQVTGVPYAQVQVLPLGGNTRAWREPEQGRVQIQWLTDRHGEPWENDIVRIHAPDFVPMLQAWIKEREAQRG